MASAVQTKLTGEPYAVFARLKRGDPIREIGVVHSPSVSLARLYARWIYDEQAWADLYVVRRTDMVRVESHRRRDLPAGAGGGSHER